ncbi:MAG: hypothetical protein KBT08_05250 [Bacteroidales bacterium]|nr:hypothetical protein [Candidatus Cryptobacteroides onthequi]
MTRRTDKYHVSRKKGFSAWEILLVLLMICFSGNPAFTSVGILGKIGGLLLVMLTLSVFWKRIRWDEWKRLLSWQAVLVLIFAMQFVNLHYVSPLACVNFMSKLAAAILIPYVLGRKFRVIYLRIMTVAGAVSLVFYALNLCGVFFPSLLHLDQPMETLIVYTQREGGYIGSSMYRNSGMFWEPGAFAGYIVLAFMLYIDDLKFLVYRHLPSVLVLLVCLLTTFSTAGYLLTAILTFFYIFLEIRKKILIIPVLLVLIPAVAVLFTRSEFLGEKIAKQFEGISTMDMDSINYERLGSLIFDSQYIAMHPLFGNGLAGKTRYALHQQFSEETLAAFSNGFSGCIASMGVIFMLMYLAALYRNPTLTRKWLLLILVILALQSEYFLNYPLYLSVPFADFCSRTTRRDGKKSRKRRIRFVWRKSQS